ncbi:hypothetical protein BaRGS_00006461 [Batillaria attramentaria]|uniref:Mitochondrial ribosomal protein L1 n=1 Tax=Batillaria attramentaria TaxID=370345 RepID=A0ABD0LSQ2_9CAEN
MFGFLCGRGLRSLLLVTASRHAVDQCICLSPAVMQVRHKVSKKTRARAPHVPQEKEKWTRTLREKSAQVKDPRQTNSPVFLSRVPVDDVWIRTYYPQPKFSLEETIIRHKEAADPTMLDNMEGLVYADMELDMKTGKKTKFLSNVKGTVLLPHDFEQNVEQQRIAIFCQKEEDVAKAKDLGAAFVGAGDLVKQVFDGLIDKDEIDTVLCTPDTLQDLIPIRSILRDKFPSKARGNLSTNLDEMWTLFTKGVTYSSQKKSDAVGKLQLKMPVEDLMENFLTYVNALCEGRSKSLGPFITKVFIIAPPSRERFLLKVEDYVPGYATKERKDDEDSDSDDEDEERGARRK